MRHAELPVSPDAPIRALYQAEDFYLDLDVGIRFAVRVLHAAGIETNQSCQGGPGHSYAEPSIDMDAPPSCATGFRALSALAAYGLPVASVSIAWLVEHGLPMQSPVWRITFSGTMEDRADEQPMFVHGYRVNCSYPTADGR